MGHQSAWVWAITRAPEAPLTDWGPLMTWLCLAQPREELPPPIWEDPSLQQIVEGNKSLLKIWAHYNFRRTQIGNKFRKTKACKKFWKSQTLNFKFLLKIWAHTKVMRSEDLACKQFRRTQVCNKFLWIQFLENPVRHQILESPRLWQPLCKINCVYYECVHTFQKLAHTNHKTTDTNFKREKR